MKRAKTGKAKLKRIFGLVSLSEGGELVLSRSMTPLGPVLESLSGRKTDADLFQLHEGIKPEEIKAARAYACRFGTDVRNPAPLPEGGKSLLLDENITYGLLPLASRLFGPASHVEAEGLSRQNPGRELHRKKIDREICLFAIANRFAGILTCDSDFAHMFRQPDHPVRQLRVFMMPHGKNLDTLSQIVINNSGAISRALTEAPQLVRL